MDPKDQVAEVMGNLVLQIAPLIRRGMLTHFEIDFELEGKTYTLALIQTEQLLKT